jgi:hypothetical protein
MPQAPERDDVLPGFSTNKQGMDKRKEKIKKRTDIITDISPKR